MEPRRFITVSQEHVSSEYTCNCKYLIKDLYTKLWQLTTTRQFVARTYTHRQFLSSDRVPRHVWVRNGQTLQTENKVMSPASDLTLIPCIPPWIWRQKDSPKCRYPTATPDSFTT